ncbi:MAG: hypothetical protein HYZ32_00350 [Hydrocarboniphaga effusa]|nr:hypothetical protein [Hydrocarboniphaga effusa]
MLNTIKDGALALALKAYLNERFAEYGKISSCELDTVAGCLKMEAMLKGERDPISATLEHFELVRDNGQPFMILHEFSSSRQWLALLLTKLFAGKRYPLPATFAALL